MTGKREDLREKERRRKKETRREGEKLVKSREGEGREEGITRLLVEKTESTGP